MIVEIVAVGTELLLGQIVNGNAATIGASLADHGFDVHFQDAVGDNLERIGSVLRTAVSRSDAVIITGGIGPTQDDLTREAICAAFGLQMEYSETYAAEMTERWTSTGRVMPSSNLKQAQYPKGAEMLNNPKGTAPGLTLSVAGKRLFALPGVPEEMEHLLSNEVLPRLMTIAGEEAVVRSRVVRSWGRPESQIGELLDDLYHGRTNPSIAFLASGGEIKVRITAKAPTLDAAEALIAPVEVEVRSRLGASVFGADDETIERVVAERLTARGWTIGTAESATGGMVSTRLTSLPGSSSYFRGAVVAYAADLKASLLGVSDLSPGLVSTETGNAMARGARSMLGVDVAVAVVGSAGPLPMEQPVGTMVIAVITPEGEGVKITRFPGDRERIRTYASTAALHLVRLALTGEWWT